MHRLIGWLFTPRPRRASRDRFPDRDEGPVDDPRDREALHPYAGAWESPWEGRNRFWMYPIQGRAWLQIESDGAVDAQIIGSPGSGLSQWKGRMLVTVEIELEELPTGEAFGSAHGEGEILPNGILHVKLLIGRLGPVPFDAELDLKRRQG